jgi:hypothetical protein
MQRFLAVGHTRLHVLEAGIHSPSEARRIRATLAALGPRRLWFDLAPSEWRAILAAEKPTGLAKRLLRAAGAAGAVQPFAVYLEAYAWAEAERVPVRFLLDKPEPAPRLAVWRLDRIVRREGFEAADPTAALRRLHQHYVSRVPALVSWLDRRWAAAARALLMAERDAGSGGVVLCGLPDGEGIADRVQRLA